MTQKLIAFTLLVLGTSFAQQTKPATPAALAATAFLANEQLADKKIDELANVRWTVEKREVERERYILDAGEAERALQSSIRNESHDIIQNFANAVEQGHAGFAETCKAASLLDAAMKRRIEKQLGFIHLTADRKQYEAEELLRTPGVEILYSTIGKCTALRPWIIGK